ncbi:HAD domain-containing protein [Myroides odoratus]|uniref:Uncharacterized protein n=2 Tax=Myroides odoratus TaxID=256 RepID=A0A378RLR3_MYROD|nr:HAD domain-containing protein [Myroides odoratus]QQU04607.1 hypothetical protein I6I89_04785 [Myroides odoratus]STZ27956.1 Uncharacterised protein [Myroides odoratus]
MKVFLDIDGVMVHGNPQKKVEIAEDGFYVFMTKAIAIFNQIEVDEIILSTSHRNRFSIAEWSALLKIRGLKFSKLTKMISCSPYTSRKEEIETHIATYHLLPEDILILDDDKSIYGLSPHIKERAIVTQSFLGLTAFDLADIQTILQVKVK